MKYEYSDKNSIMNFWLNSKRDLANRMSGVETLFMSS